MFWPLVLDALFACPSGKEETLAEIGPGQGHRLRAGNPQPRPGCKAGAVLAALRLKLAQIARGPLEIRNISEDVFDYSSGANLVNWHKRYLCKRVNAEMEPLPKPGF